MTKLFRFKSFVNKSGTLIPLEIDKKFPIKVRRIFFIYGEKNYLRADHAHKKCSQFFIPIFGKIKLNYKNKKNKSFKILDFKKKEGFLLGPKNWCKIKFLTRNAILMVVCDRRYEFSDYIENYKDFLKFIK
jgi:hypothetical protein|tara:strand:+ start:127 stop:519 length:393 start_codon:yes stop_codon:yes gene_type:complete